MDHSTAELTDYVQSNPGSPLFAYLAETLAREGDEEWAYRICRAGVEGNPGFITGWIVAGSIALSRAEYSFAKQALLTALDIDPGAIRARELLLRWRAEIELSRNQVREIAGILLKLIPDHELASTVLKEVEKGQSGSGARTEESTGAAEAPEDSVARRFQDALQGKTAPETAEASGTGEREEERESPAHPQQDTGADPQEETELGGTGSGMQSEDLSREEMGETLRDESRSEKRNVSETLPDRQKAVEEDEGQATGMESETGSDEDVEGKTGDSGESGEETGDTSQSEILQEIEEPTLQITERMATFTFANVLKSQGLHEQAYKVLEILRGKSDDIERIEREQEELRRLIDSQNES